MQASQINIIWTGREYDSAENCLVHTTPQGAEIRSTIVGHYEGKIYRVEYHIKTNADWETVFVEITSRHSNRERHIVMQSDGKGNWTTGGKADAAFKDCTDVDIPLTPFTNTLPIKRLKLKDGEQALINVVYLDLLAEKIYPVRQKYTRISATRYHYENVPNDFEATIEVDEKGLVADYPQLFTRTASLDSSYKI